MRLVRERVCGANDCQGSRAGRTGRLDVPVILLFWRGFLRFHAEFFLLQLHKLYKQGQRIVLLYEEELYSSCTGGKNFFIYN